MICFNFLMFPACSCLSYLFLESKRVVESLVFSPRETTCRVILESKIHWKEKVNFTKTKDREKKKQTWFISSFIHDTKMPSPSSSPFLLQPLHLCLPYVFLTSSRFFFAAFDTFQFSCKLFFWGMKSKERRKRTMKLLQMKRKQWRMKRQQKIIEARLEFTKEKSGEKHRETHHVFHVDTKRVVHSSSSLSFTLLIFYIFMFLMKTSLHPRGKSTHLTKECTFCCLHWMSLLLHEEDDDRGWWWCNQRMV